MGAHAHMSNTSRSYRWQTAAVHLRAANTKAFQEVQQKRRNSTSRSRCRGESVTIAVSFLNNDASTTCECLTLWIRSSYCYSETHQSTTELRNQRVNVGNSEGRKWYEWTHILITNVVLRIFFPQNRNTSINQPHKLNFKSSISGVQHLFTSLCVRVHVRGPNITGSCPGVM